MAGVDELGRPALDAPRALAPGQGLVDRQGGHGPDAILVRVEQRFAVRDPASFTVCQSQPKAAATSVTDRA